MLYLNPEVRTTNLAEKAILENLSNTNLDQEQCSHLCQSNFRGFDKSVYRVFKNPILLDSVKYSEENLVLSESEGRAFSLIDHLDGIRFYANVWYFDKTDIVWRDFQHVYDLGQKLLIQSKKPKIFYLAMQKKLFWKISQTSIWTKSSVLICARVISEVLTNLFIVCLRILSCWIQWNIPRKI